MTTIGSLDENPLHAALKVWYRCEGDLVEASLEGSAVDLVRDGLLIEIQTRGFSAMRKFDRLLGLFDTPGAPGGCRQVDGEARRRRSPGVAAPIAGSRRTCARS